MPDVRREIGEPVRPGESFKASWTSVDQADDPAAYVHFMDRFRPREVDTLPAYRRAFDLLEVRQGERILDVGCGTGGAVRALAELVGPAGRATGVDISATMIEEAQRRTEGSGLPAEFTVGDAHALPFDDACFDGCYSSGSLDIMDDPARAVQEMVRVVRVGGRLLATGTDVGTWALDAADRQLTRRILDFVCDYERNGWLGRQLPRLFSACGLRDIAIVPEARISFDFALYRDLWLRTHLDNAQRAGVVTGTEAVAWLRDLEERAREGRFFLASMLFFVRGRKP